MRVPGSDDADRDAPDQEAEESDFFEEDDLSELVGHPLEIEFKIIRAMGTILMIILALPSRWFRDAKRHMQRHTVHLQVLG